MYTYGCKTPLYRRRQCDADRTLITELATLFRWVNSRLLNHLIIGQDESFSFAKAGVLQLIGHSSRGAFFDVRQRAAFPRKRDWKCCRAGVNS